MNQRDSSLPSSDDIDPLFLVSETPALVPPVCACNQSVANWYAHCITRRPQDLSAHVHRIYLLRALGGGDALADAMVDLFIALGSARGTLKGLLMVTFGISLPERARNYLAQRIEQGVSVHANLPWNARPVLWLGPDGIPLFAPDQES